MLASDGNELITDVRFTDDDLVVTLADGRTLSAPLVWYPSLLNASEEERNDWRLIGDGEGIHWPQLDEDLSATGLLRGLRAPEVSRQVAGGKFEIYRDAGGEYRWRFRAGNNEIVASGEGYRSRADAEHAIQLIKEQSSQSEVETSTSSR
jgi:uncharacterized protein YegP (UPF0339 family)